MLAAAVSLSFSCVTPVFTQELPSEGKFSITYTAVNPAPSKAVSVGDRDVTVSSSIMTGVNDAGSGLLHNMAGRCNFMTGDQQGRQDHPDARVLQLCGQGGRSSL
jgi:hypothetical protein